MFFGREAFIGIEDRAAAKDLFARSVGRIEIETHSYCNRRCGYCPNVVGDRLGDNKRMDPALFSGVVRDLAEVEWAGNFVLTSYNEPLADRIILERIAEAHAALPKARMMIYTNGDYLTPQYVQDLTEAGLDYMHISIHMNAADVYSDIYGLDRIAEVTTRMGIPAKFKKIKNNEFIVARAPHRKMEIELRAINYWKHGKDRGGLIQNMPVPQEARRLPCYFPFEYMHIGFEGNIVPCCHIRSDNEVHRPYRTGNLRDFPSLFQAYASTKLAGWRRHLISNKPKEGPCATCTAHFISEDPKVLARVQDAYTRYVVPMEQAERAAKPRAAQPDSPRTPA
jgi:hypothetical protein